jgi:hypothetical protein
VFSRPAEGMWLPETAVDIPSLEALAAAGVHFTIVASDQIEGVRPLGADLWAPASGDDALLGRSYTVPLPSGNKMIVVPYGRALSHGVAFDGWLHDGASMAQKLVDAAAEHEFVLLATVLN